MLIIWFSRLTIDYRLSALSIDSCTQHIQVIQAKSYIHVSAKENTNTNRLCQLFASYCIHWRHDWHLNPSVDMYVSLPRRVVSRTRWSEVVTWTFQLHTSKILMNLHSCSKLAYTSLIRRQYHTDTNECAIKFASSLAVLENWAISQDKLSLRCMEKQIADFFPISTPSTEQQKCYPVVDIARSRNHSNDSWQSSVERHTTGSLAYYNLLCSGALHGFHSVGCINVVQLTWASACRRANPWVDWSVDKCASENDKQNRLRNKADNCSFK